MLLAGGAVALVALVIVALVIVKVSTTAKTTHPDVAVTSPTSTGLTPTSAISPPAGFPLSKEVTAHLTSVPLSALVAAPTSAIVSPITAIHDAPLTVDGKPEVLYVGAEFCPICAAERWALYVALSKFGTFDPAPGQIHSAVSDGDIPTLTFYGTTYSSPYLTFVPVEMTTNQPSGDYYVSLEGLTPAQAQLWEAHTSQTFPWIDFGGSSELRSSQYSPGDLVGQSFATIAADVGNNQTKIGADVDASAAALIKTLCTLTGQQPASTCHAG